MYKQANTVIAALLCAWAFVFLMIVCSHYTTPATTSGRPPKRYELVQSQAWRNNGVQHRYHRDLFVIISVCVLMLALYRALRTHNRFEYLTCIFVLLMLSFVTITERFGPMFCSPRSLLCYIVTLFILFILFGKKKHKKNITH
jgi:hypothetical protein